MSLPVLFRLLRVPVAHLMGVPAVADNWSLTAGAELQLEARGTGVELVRRRWTSSLDRWTSSLDRSGEGPSDALACVLEGRVTGSPAALDVGIPAVQ